MSQPEDDRDPIEILAEEFLEEHRTGRQVTVSAYAQKHPELAEEIEEVFPALLAMEGAKPRQVLTPPLQSFEAVAKGQIRKLGDFRIIRKIANGGMGIVYEAEEMSLGRKVAIKVLAANLISDEAALERFKREAKTIARLHHTNIVSVFGAGNENELYYFVMEYIDGKSLERIIKGNEFSTHYKNRWDRVAEIVKRIALALRHAHEKNVLHRDVKPGNILIDLDGKPWITDFGLAKLDENDDLTRPGDAVGTLRYMAPEQLKGNPDHRSDIFGLGLVLYELLVGQKAYGESEAQNLIERITSRDLPLPSKLNPEVPRDLEMIAMKAISRDPNDRYQKALEFADDLDRWQGDLPIRARPLTTVEAVYRWAKRNPVVATLSSIVILLFAVLVISFSVITFSWLEEYSAKLDAKIAQTDAEKSRLESEKSVQKAMEILDQFMGDLAVFNRIGTGDDERQSFLFSPMGGIPVSRKTAKQLDLMNHFYRTVGQSTGIRAQLKYRRYLANIRSSEIDLHLRNYAAAEEDLGRVLSELQEETDSKFVSLRLYAGDLIGYANLQANDLSTAKMNFHSQLELIEASELEGDEKTIERGKANLGLGLVAHSEGDVQNWHDHLMAAIAEFEKQWDDSRAVDDPEASIFLARCFMNIPPRFRTKGYAEYYRSCKIKAVNILYQLHQSQLAQFDDSRSGAALLFFYDYCEAVSSLPRSLPDIKLSSIKPSGEKSIPVIELLQQTISECEKIVDANATVPAFRFALAKCQVNLAMRINDQQAGQAEFDKGVAAAMKNFEWLTGNYPDAARFLTAHADLNFKLGVKSLTTRNSKMAKMYFQKSVSLLEQSIKISSGYPKTQVLLQKVHGRLALVFEQMNDRRASSYHASQQAAWEKLYPHPSETQNSPELGALQQGANGKIAEPVKN